MADIAFKGIAGLSASGPGERLEGCSAFEHAPEQFDVLGER